MNVPRWRYRLFKYGFFVFAAMFAVMLAYNYNYTIFKFLISSNYIFEDSLKSLYVETLSEENVKGLGQNFDHFVVSAVTEKIRAYNGDRYTYLYTPQTYTLSKEMEKADAEEARIEQLTDNTVYMLLPNISSGTKDFVVSKKSELAKYKNLVIDLRGNYGGMLMDAYTMAELFTARGDVLGYEKMRLPFLTHAVKSGNGAYFDFERIIILQDANTASAAESIISALKGNLGNVTLMGQKSFGKGIGQVTVPLTGGFAVKATVLILAGPDDVSIHGQGIEPDVFVDGENIISAALEVLGDNK
ncbi:MAG: S41 family peptidase [Clostridiales bacterium]|jgi:C-terminal processing protease CtpA/Prc|nr:S41 family peptidase [Clostridiales bacterium]